jgi:hypothetical protein
MKDYATHALIGDEFQLPSEERLQLTLAEPNNPAAMSQPAVRGVVLNRLRYSLADLMSTERPNIIAALEEVRRVDPARYVGLYIELLQFSMPKLKAVAMEVTDHSPGTKQMTIADLQRIVSEQ